MDDTTQSRSSDVAAAATRKRRSSILKSQRPPRTPFCELEFNACTPTDTTKSRRVSFSRRTGVAEFVTNEATTTWKNFYEEHNKSLESSGNEPGINHGRQPVVHLGKRIFDEQFEEVEAIDFMGTINPGINMSSSINHINFAQLECTETKLTAPQSNFELSALTETKSNLFKDNLATTCIDDASARIDVNFSMADHIGQNDDLDEIQKDLQRHRNVIRQGQFMEHNLSEYVEVDLNMTHIAPPNDESDMSITDTIQLPKVQDVSKSCSIDKKMSINNKDWVTDKENIVLNPYVAPRESVNFAITEMPEEVLVFDGKRLIVETEKPKKDNYRHSVLPKPLDRTPQRKTTVLNCNDDLPNFLEEMQFSKNQSSLLSVTGMQRSCLLEETKKSSQRNLDDLQNKQKTIIFNDDLDDISVTQAVGNVIANVEKRHTILYDNKFEDISVTQALPSKILEMEKRRTVVFENDNADISITQSVPANVIIPSENNEKRQTVVFENDSYNISMTQAIPTNIMPEKYITKRQTVVLEDYTTNVSINKVDSKESRRSIAEDKIGNISIISSSSSVNKSALKKRTTVVFGSDIGNISMTQTLPSNIMLPQKINTATYGNDANISMTEALPASILLGNNIEPNRRSTVYEDGNLSITQAVPKNQVIEGFAHQQYVIAEPVATNEEVNFDLGNDGTVFDKTSKNAFKTQAPSTINQVYKQQKDSIPLEETVENRRRTIVFQNEAADISITQAVPIRQVIDNFNIQNQKDVAKKEEINDISTVSKNLANRTKTCIFENDDANISLTLAIPQNRVIGLVNEQMSNANYDHRATQDIKVSSIGNNSNQHVNKLDEENYTNETTNIHLYKGESNNKRKTVVFNNEEADISMTQAVPMNKLIDAMYKENHNLDLTNVAPPMNEITNKRNTIVFENDEANISMTQAVPINKLIDAIEKECHVTNEAPLKDGNNTRKTVVFENEEADVSMTQAVSMNKVIDVAQKENHNLEVTNVAPIVEIDDKLRTLVFENEQRNISMTQAEPMNQFFDIMQKENFEITNRRKTVNLINEEANISHAIHTNHEINSVQKDRHSMKVTDVISHEEALINETKIVDFGSNRADINMALAVSMKPVIGSIQTENNTNNMDNANIHQEETTNKSKTIINVEIYEDINTSMMQAASMDIVDNIQKENHNNCEAPNVTHLEEEKVIKKEVLDNDDAVLSQAAGQNQLLYKQEKEESKHCVTKKYSEVNDKINCNNGTNNKTSCIVYNYDKEDVSMTHAISSSIILLEGQGNKITESETLLENKSLFMEIDKLTEGVKANRNSVKLIENESDISMLEISDMEIEEKKPIEYDNQNVCITKAFRDNFSPIKHDKSRLEKIEEHAPPQSKPIPVGLVELQQKNIDKSYCKIIEKNNTLSDFLVYQSFANTQDLTKKTEKEDTENMCEDEKAIHVEKVDSLESLKIGSEPKIITSQEDALSQSNNEIFPKTTSNHSAVKTVDSKPNNSILNELLDMSSFGSTEDKNLMAETKSDHETPANVSQADSKVSSDTMFYITKDDDGEDRPVDKSETDAREIKQIQEQSPLSIEYKENDDPPLVRDLRAKLSTVKAVLREDHVVQFKPSEHDKLEEDTSSKVSLDMSRRKTTKSIKMANDTTELLDMLSDFTDNNRSCRNLPLEDLKENDADDILETRSAESKEEAMKPEPPRFNHALKRQSVVLSREDLLKNLSMASAMLQKSRSELDDSVSIAEETQTPNMSHDHKKSLRLSSEVVKTLHFDDDSIHENEVVKTPLKKTAFGEVSYMKESKSKVIPGFMYNVTDGVKELMDDLVKPIFSSQPFTNTPPENKMKKAASTCSTQIQANLLASSQIDLHTELYSTTDSVCEMNKLSSGDLIVDAVNRSMSRALTSSVKSVPLYAQSTKSSDLDATSNDNEDESVSPALTGRPEGSVLIFDHTNPLNNVLLVAPPPHAIDIHKYDPIKPEEPAPQNKGTGKRERLTKYHVEFSTTSIHEYVNKSETESVTSNTSKGMSIDQCTEPQNSYVRDTEVNTVITMKRNEELLEASSSLTLVNEESNRNDKYFRTITSLRDTANSPVNVHYKEEEATKMETDSTSTDEAEGPQKPKKRVYSPTKREKHEHGTLPSSDVTPKPVSKMQKRSTSPDYREPTKLPAEREQSPELVKIKRSPTRPRSPRRNRKKSGMTVTVQQLAVMLHVEPDKKEECERLDSNTTLTTDPQSASECHGTSSEIVSSFASSNNLRSEASLAGSSVSRNVSKVNWQPMSVASSIADGVRSEDDIVGLIEAMPFMGSPECQWESVSEGAWRILLLHSRLRLTILFAGGARLRRHTPVLGTELEMLHRDKKNPIAYLCVTYAGAMVRHYMSRGCGTAADCAKLVRRASGAARLAAQWARAMGEARVRLAYSLTHDGRLALKVANTSFRTVWEVTMQLELVVEHARAAPWPRACHVRVAAVLAPAGVAPPDVARVAAAVPRDWGHAPRTIWRVFRYLKHRKYDDFAILKL